MEGTQQVAQGEQEWRNEFAYSKEDLLKMPASEFLVARKEQVEAEPETPVIKANEVSEDDLVGWGEILNLVEKELTGESVPFVHFWETRERCFACGKTIPVGKEYMDAKGRVRHGKCWYDYCRWMASKGYRIPANLNKRAKEFFVRSVKVKTTETEFSVREWNAPFRGDPPVLQQEKELDSEEEELQELLYEIASEFYDSIGQALPVGFVPPAVPNYQAVFPKQEPE